MTVTPQKGGVSVYVHPRDRLPLLEWDAGDFYVWYLELAQTCKC